MAKISKIISGGQTGADRAALDTALERGIEIGGFVPKNRLAEDGRLPDKYPNLIETDTQDTAERTEKNVRYSDATLILSYGAIAGGSKLTEVFALKFQKPVLHIDLLTMSVSEAVASVQNWLDATDCSVLNVAGPRASEDEQIYESVHAILSILL